VNTPAQTIKVLVVDDHAVVRAGYRRLLEHAAGIVVVGEAETGRIACQRYQTLTPDVVIMDLSLPDMSGFEAIRYITARDQEARVLVFSMHEDAAFVERALEAGACGYVTKSSAPEVLVEAVQCVADGMCYLSPDVEHDVAAQKPAAAADPLRALSVREFEIFRLLAEGRTVSEIGTVLCLSTKTVANYSTQIRNKLGVATNAELTRLAIRHRLLTP